jgi:anaerobic magnesium-protoporphyrin IX monomethyl ester cyclase
MKIALIQCPLWGTYEPPTALAQLSSCLKKEGHSVMVLDLNIKLYLNRKKEYKNFWAWEQGDVWYKPEFVSEYASRNSEDIDNYVNLLLNREIELAGFSVNTASLHMSYEFAKRLKTRNKEIKILFGGPLFLNRRYINDVLDSGLVDIVIPGEGESSVGKLASSLDKKMDISLIPGIAFKSNGKIVVNDPAAAINLDSLPFLDFTDLALTDYDDSRHVSLMSSRGCIRRCYFCSDAPCWPGYRAMSGERIFQEMAFHKNIHQDIGHVRFLDLEFNGDMKSLIKLCSLMKDRPLDVYWSANMIIRPEMSAKVIRGMARSGCEHIIFGIESGSERLLKRMNKHYRMKDADRIIRQMHEEGICVTTNFMFGFPGETEDDFKQTLDFINRNARFLDRVYPSRTYFALEEFSHVYDHPEEFAIKPAAGSHLFWESLDGINTYPVRMDRCRRFCELALESGIEVGAGVQTSILQDEWFNLARYYEIKQDYPRAVENLLKYYAMDPDNEVVNKKIMDYEEIIKNYAFLIEDAIVKELTLSIKNIHDSFKSGTRQTTIARLDSGFSKVSLKTKMRNLNNLIKTKEYNEGNRELFSSAINGLISLMDANSGYDIADLRDEYIDTMKILSGKNSLLNDAEFKENKVTLASSPKRFFLQFAGPCNSSCVFCSRGSNYEHFNLSAFKEKIEAKIALQLALAEQFIFTGSGEYLRLPDWSGILNYFEKRYPYIEKMFSTNGSSLRPEVVDLITSHKSRYLIHVSLHASNAKLHKTIVRMDNFENILEQIKYLVECRKKNDNVKVNLFFVATLLNIDDLPDFVDLAKKLGVDKVIVNYNYIYVPAQKYLSCYFKQGLTNQMLEEARQRAHEVGIDISLPAGFGMNNYPRSGVCRELWTQIMLNEKGHILPCDASHDCNLKLEDSRYFDSIWNSEYYVRIRQELIESGNADCYRYCHRANPAAVNLFSSHVIHRGRQGEKIDEFWEDNF